MEITMNSISKFFYIFVFCITSMSLYAELKFKDVEINDSGDPLDGYYDFSFVFTNEGDSELMIAGVSAPCSCTNVSADISTVYAPGHAGSVSGRFNYGSRSGLQKAEILVSDSGGVGTRLSLNIFIPSLVDFIGKRILLWETGSQNDGKITRIRLNSNYKVKLRSIRSMSDHFLLEWKLVSDGNNDEHVYEISVHPVNTENPMSGVVIIDVDIGNDKSRSYFLHTLIR